MRRKLRLTMEIEIRDMDADERKQCANMDGCKPSELPRLRDYLDDPMEVAGSFGGAIDNADDLFAGSFIYLRAVEAQVTDAEWST